jgi:DNA-binding transcriptional ArsR family regulator
MDPMWEIVGSLHAINDPGHPPCYNEWLAGAVDRLRNRRLLAATRAMSAIAPLRSYFPDFLTPDRATQGLDADIEAVLATPQHRLRSEIGSLGRPSGWLAGMAVGDADTLNRFGDLLRFYYQHMLEPDQARLEVVIAAHRSAALENLTDSGTEGLLSNLAPMIRWRPPYLEAKYPHDRTVDLAGRGLLLVPSYFCHRTPITLADPTLAPVLVYPVQHSMTERAGEGLPELIGSTRAEVLKAVLGGASTTDIADRVNISVATASHHARVLRNAGIVTSIRVANRVVHRPAAVGLALLAGSDDPTTRNPMSGRSS